MSILSMGVCTQHLPGRGELSRRARQRLPEAATRDGRLIEGREVDRSVLAEEEPDAERVSSIRAGLHFLSICWSFFGLRAAALLRWTST